MKTDKDKSDAKEDLIRYFKYLQDNQKQITNNLDNLIIWGGWAKSKNIVNWILNNYVEEDIAQFYSKVFGLNNNNLISISKLKKIL